MKFKNEKNADEGQEARILSITDKAGDTLTVRAYIDGNPQVLIDINDGIYEEHDNYACVSMSRDKALKFAYAIIQELDDAI